MAKAVKVLCDRCENKIVAGVSFCDHCSYPTRWATHEERATWEVDQWKTADRSHKPKSSSKSDRNGRRWNPFGRKQEPKPALTLVAAASPAAPQAVATEPDITIELEPAPVVMAAADPASVAAPPKPIARPERTRPERTLGLPKPVRAKPQAKAAPAKTPPAPVLAPGKADDEAVSDTPATIMAMRLLNARVAELDAKIRRLEQELGTSEQSARAQ